MPASAYRCDAMRVLVVEDHVTLTDQIAQGLRHAGMAVDSRVRGPAAHGCSSADGSGDPQVLGQIPVLAPPLEPPKVCTQSAVTVAPDIGARHREDLAFGSPQWAQTYAAYRSTFEGTNGYLKDTAHESLASPSRRRVRGIAAQSPFVGLLLMAANARKIAAYRDLIDGGEGPQVAERARRRRVSLTDYRPPPPQAI
jgi:hypothetical protein